MPRNENHVYDEDGNDLLAQKPRRPLGTLFAGLGVLAALAAGGWAFHHYRPQQFGKIFSLPGQNPVLSRQARDARWLGPPTPTAAHNALLNAVAVRLLQLRPIPDTSVNGLKVSGVAADLEVSFTNTSNRSITLGVGLYFNTACHNLSLLTFSLPYMPEMLPSQDSVWSVAHHLSGGVNNPANLYLALAPHQTKTGWMGVDDLTSCGINQLILTDNRSTVFPGGVTQAFPFPSAGPPMSSTSGS